MTLALPIRLIGLLVAGGTLALLGSTVTEPEEELKAAVVLGILRYTEWPSPADSGPLTVGVSGRASFAQVLRRILSGKTVNSRPFRVIELNGAPDPRCCQAIYFATEKASEIRPSLTSIGLAPVLTIGDTKSFLELGGILNLLTIDGHMSFEIRLDVLEKSKVNISSKVLRFGRIRGGRGTDQ